MLLKEQCPICKKEIKSIQSQFEAMGKLHLVVNCGHLVVKELVSPATPVAVLPMRDFTCDPPTKEELYNDLDRWVAEGGAVKDIPYSLPSNYIHEVFWSTEKCKPFMCPECKITHNRQHAYKYQREGVVFAERAQLKALIGDAPALGKTVQAAILLRRNKALAIPALVLVRGATIFQWAKEIRKWYSNDFSAVMPIVDRINIMPGFQVYIMSQDLLGRKGVLDLVKKLNIKCIVIDEAQFYKDTSSERCKALYQLITEQKIEYRLPLSGTYIKNRMSEAFTVLNLLDPSSFRSPKEFNNRWLVPNENGVYARLNPIYEKQFREMTSHYIIRREKNEVFQDLPPLTRDYQLIEITDPYVKKTYNHEIGLIESFFKDPRVTSTQILGWLAKLRAITGMAKANWAVEWVNAFLNASDDSICIGIHHNNVRETLYNVFKANKLNPLSLSGEDDVYDKNRIANAFSSGQNRILIMNMLAGGVGLNIHNCSNALVLEREWNSADEEQFEGRFRDLILKKIPVQITYAIAKGTIDEFFHELVFNKRNILAKDAKIGQEDDETNSIGFLKEFAEFIAGQKI
jgi:SNF2 family DNA or RNA helicase